MTLLERITDRKVVTDHDGRSGSCIERGRLDGHPVYVKHTDVDTDLIGHASGTARRELELFEAGVFDRLPAQVGSALVGVDDLGDCLVTVTRDLGDAMLSWDTMLTGGQVRRIFSAMAAVHAQHGGSPPIGLCPLAVRLSLFAPDVLERTETASDLMAAVRRGRELFAGLVPTVLAEAVDRNLRDPRPLAAALDTAGVTLLHGDFWIVNLALEGDVLVPLDWGLATEGPPAIDFVSFCVGAMSNVALDRGDLLDEARSACADFADDDVFALAEFWALMELGWNKALDIVEHADAAKRVTEQADLDFWIARAMVVLEAGLVP